MIPAYQLNSLAGDIIAKKRVVAKQHKQYETEEQRTLASGKIDDNVKSVFELILKNLQMQLTTLSVAEATVGMDERYNDQGDLEAPEDMQYTTQGVIGGFAKLVGFSFELKFLFTKLQELKKGVLPSLDYPRISVAFAKVREAYGVFEDEEDGGYGFLLVLRNVIQARNQAGLQVPQVDKLMNMYEKKMEECEEILARLQGNVYQQSLTGVLLERDKKADPNAVEMTKAEYQHLVDLAEEGFLHDDDFSIATNMRSAFFRRIGQRDPDDDSTLASYESSSGSEDEESSSDDDSSGTSYTAPRSVFSSAQSSRQSGHHSHGHLHGSQQGSVGSNVSGNGLSGGRVYKIPQQQRIHGGLPLRYY